MLIQKPNNNKWRKKRHYQKQWQNSDLIKTKQIIYHSKSIDESYLKWTFFY